MGLVSQHGSGSGGADPQVLSGAGAPVTPPADPALPALYVDDVSSIITHRWDVSPGAWVPVGLSPAGGNIVALTPIRSGPETVVSFDGIEIKWHDGAAAGFDGIAVRVPGGARNFTYNSNEQYLAQSIHDAGNSTWGSANRWYALPAGGGVATLGTAAWPHHFPVGATWVGMGNPALPQTNFRHYMLYDHTSNQTYRITVHKNGSTGEVFGAHVGYCMIVVERMGLTSLNVVPPMGAATPLAAGTAGVVPAPPAGGTSDLLRGDGTWYRPAHGAVAHVGPMSINTVFAAVPFTSSLQSLNVTQAVGVAPFTISVPGVYRVYFDGEFLNVSAVLGGPMVADIQATLNGGPTSRLRRATVANGDRANLVGYAVLTLAAGDVVGLHARCTGDSPNELVNSMMNIERIS